MSIYSLIPIIVGVAIIIASTVQLISNSYPEEKEKKYKKITKILLASGIVILIGGILFLLLTII